jgi:protein-disulfide isomerase
MFILRRNHCACFLFMLIFAGAAAACRSGEKKELKEELSELRSEVMSLKQLRYDVQAVQNELETVKSQLGKGVVPEPAIKPVTFLPDGSHRDDAFLGPKDAKVMIMAFGDFQCHPCRQFYTDTLPAIKKEFVETEQVMFIYRDFPVGSHAFAQKAAQLTHCAGEQGMYWRMFDIMFQNPNALDEGNLADLIAKLQGVDQKKLKKCTEGSRYEREIQRDVAEGKRLGAKGAPGFFIGKAEKNGQLSGVFIRGAQPYPVLRAEIIKALE